MSARGHSQITRWGPLGELELAILEDLWRSSGDAGGSDAKAVHGRIGGRRGITLNTVQSGMKRLHEKGLLRREKVSHAYLYVPAVARDAFRQTLVEDAIEPVLAGEASTMIAAFVDLAERAGDETLARLEELVAARRRERGSRK